MHSMSHRGLLSLESGQCLKHSINLIDLVSTEFDSLLLRVDEVTVSE